MYTHPGKSRATIFARTSIMGLESRGESRQPCPDCEVRAARVEHHFLDEGTVEAAQIRVVSHNPVERVPGRVIH